MVCLYSLLAQKTVGTGARIKPFCFLPRVLLVQRREFLMTLGKVKNYSRKFVFHQGLHPRHTTHTCKKVRKTNNRERRAALYQVLQMSLRSSSKCCAKKGGGYSGKSHQPEFRLSNFSFQLCDRFTSSSSLTYPSKLLVYLGL